MKHIELGSEDSHPVLRQSTARGSGRPPIISDGVNRLKYFSTQGLPRNDLAQLLLTENEVKVVHQAIKDRISEPSVNVVEHWDSS